MSLNAVSELALLGCGYGQNIPAEFWNGDGDFYPENDLHFPLGECVPNPEPELTSEELREQHLELGTELLRREEELRPLESSMAFRGRDGVYCFHVAPDPNTIAVMSQMKSVPYATPDKPETPTKNIILPTGLRAPREAKLTPRGIVSFHHRHRHFPGRNQGPITIFYTGR